MKRAKRKIYLIVLSMLLDDAEELRLTEKQKCQVESLIYKVLKSSKARRKFSK